MQRRDFIKGLGAAALSPALARATTSEAKMPRGKAEHVIFLWLGGGMAQIDTFDPKELGDAKASPKKAGSYYASIPTSVKNVRLCEHLAKTAPLVDRMTIVRTVNHRVIDEHAFATNIVHTGRMISGNIVYPSIDSIISHKQGPKTPDEPTYMLVGYPNVSRGPGFLGAKHGFIYLVDTTVGPSGFTLPGFVSPERMARRQQLLAPLRERVADESLPADYETAQ